jgi:hypothetical protein
MSTDLGRQLPDDLFHQLSDVVPSEQSGKVIPICTVDSEGWAHPALLSYEEVGAKDRSTLRVITFDGTKTTENLRGNGRLTILFIDDMMTYYVKGTAHEIPPERVGGGPGHAYMDVALSHVLSDAPGAGEEGAQITSGIMFKW